MRHFIILIYVLTFASGTAALVVFIYLSKKLKSRIAFLYSLFLLIILLFLANNALSLYGFINTGRNEWYLDVIFAQVLTITLGYLCPSIILSLFLEKPSKFKIVPVIFPFIYLISAVILIPSGFISKSNIWSENMKLLKIGYIGLLAEIILLLVYSVFHIKKIKKMPRELLNSLKAGVIVFLADIPALWIQSMTPGDTVNGIHGFPDMIRFTAVPFLILAWNGIGIFNAVKYLESRSAEMPKPVENILIPERYLLTTREKELLLLLYQRKSYKEMSESLFISMHTIKSHIQNIYQKCGVRNRPELIRLINRKFQ